MSFAIAVDERAGVHGLFTFGLKLIDDDEVAVLAFEHERGIFGGHAGGFTENVGDAENVGFRDLKSSIRTGFLT